MTYQEHVDKLLSRFTPDEEVEFSRQLIQKEYPERYYGIQDKIDECKIQWRKDSKKEMEQLKKEMEQLKKEEQNDKS